ncbi:RagB/SusD family nutrient uptake outer membrane protein [Flavivirga jejuensis]|uniref:RagB/SusD family nutrient uptake outer membrane protein n=1 Tax=Flavivirga jejuensis TaxID=870487 RepID=A0ABT8WKU4_9FLAO|nr:RagB/SusD family nutrient uptake outer membrane protein [Flavivirga jejuensis]MDO5973776.1 RagB/SusD family nutrient uptake outer membrane protein [Flavivirga jejuensis]
MKHIYRILFALIAIITFNSCDDYLDIEPKGYTIPETYNDYALLLNESSLSTMDEMGYTILLTDDAEKTTDPNYPSSSILANLDEKNLNYYYFNSGSTFPEGQNDGYYVQAYSQIYTYNVVVNNIMDVTDATEEKKSATKAEAMFSRAFNYFKLVNFYGKAYDPDTASTDYGVPIILDEDINAEYVRNSVEEVYDFIINDLIEAIPLLEEYTLNIFHPTQMTGNLLLSKVYLFKGDFDNALKYANLALEDKAASPFELQDLTQYYTVKAGWFSRLIDSRTGEPMLDPIDIAENMYLKTSLYYFNQTLASQDLMDTYTVNLPTGATDKREDLYFATDELWTSETRVYEFPGATMYYAVNQRNSGMILSELYLILAEAEARVGSKDKAMEYLDYLRNYRIVGNVPLVAATNEEALKIVLDERRREFSFNADFRFQDLKRLNTEPAFAKTVTHTVDGVDYTLPPNDPRYILPLPHSVVEYNPDIDVYER